MKLKSARIKNLKLLRDLTLEFGDDPKRPLTVIRAENGSGKTSTLIALNWALYGSKGLEDPHMRLSPTMWPENTPCEISVQLDFSHTLYNQIAGESVPTTTNYRLVRAVTETPAGDRPNREADRITLFRISDVGLDKLEPPEPYVEQILPVEMRNIFFTDGDAALSFISPQLTRASKRDQVRDAIRSLLGLGLLETSETHLSRAKAKYNSEVSKGSQATQLAQTASRLAQIEEGLTSQRERRREVERQLEELARRYDDADRRLQLALQAGDHTELSRQKRVAVEQLEQARKSEVALKQGHRQLLQDEVLSLAMLGPVLGKGFQQLAQLHDAGIIPSGSVPVLEERLDIGVCVCGADLSKGTDARTRLEHLIAHQRTVDDQRKLLTELHHAAKADLQRAEQAPSSWFERLDSLERARLSNSRTATMAVDQLRVCEEKLARIDEAGIEHARKHRDSVQAALTAKRDEHRDLQTTVEQVKQELADLTPKYEEMLRRDAKLARVSARLTVTNDIRAVVQGALEELQQEYLSQVSRRMNALFLEMVGADPVSMEGEEGAVKGSSVFTSANISGYEITVHSAAGRTLNPDHELNGASKRALTFSFIWALTEVSKVTAPRIIDTPLGMMSGAVKKRVIELITAPSDDVSDAEKQVVLFLTRDEIRGIESVIDGRASRVFTLSNSDHYPVDLKNDPEIKDPIIMRCECNHRQHCRVCARNNDSAYDLKERPVVTG